MKVLRLVGGTHLAPLVAALGFALASGHVNSAATLSSIKITSGADQYTCALNAFSVSAGIVSASVGTCTPALGVADGGSTDGGSTDGGSTDGGSTDGGSTDGGVGGADPGAGSWSPLLSAVPRVVVVDQSGSAKSAVTIVPGCVNGGATEYDSACSTVSEYGAKLDGALVPVKLTNGQILSVRYPVSGTTATGGTGTLKLANAIGGAIGVDTLISLSPRPGDMTGNGQSRCTSRSVMTPSVSTGTSTFACKIDRTKSMYYLNIAVQENCTGSKCIFYVSEGSFEFR